MQSLPFGRLAAAAALVLCPLGAASLPDLDQAGKFYQHTDYQSSLKILETIQPKSGAVWALIGRNHYMQGDFKKAAEIFEKAVAADPSNSDYELWLGRAHGRRAENAGPFTAPGYAVKARQHFERSVDLDPRNMDALSDLFEYYLQAPGFMGGGIDKALAIADRMSAIDPVQGHVAHAGLAEKKKDYAAAEQHLQRAAGLAPREAARHIDLARFLARRGRIEESDQSFRKAEALAPASPQVIYARADTYVAQGRNLPDARRLLQRYLEAQLTPDDPPRDQAERLLKKASGG